MIDAIETPGRVVVIPCGGKKLARPAAAGDMYVGSYHKAARRAADALVAAAGGGTVLILSAEYGLVQLGDLIAPYDRKMGDPGSVDAETLRRQAARLGITDVADVVVLGGRRYVDAAAAVWPHATRPLDGTRGMGDQLRRMMLISRGEYDMPAAAPAPAPRRRPGRPRKAGGPAPSRSVRVGAGWDAAKKKADTLGYPFADVVDELLTLWTDGKVATMADREKGENA